MLHKIKGAIWLCMKKKIKKYRKSLSRLSAFAFMENIRMFKKIKIYYKY